MAWTGGKITAEYDPVLRGGTIMDGTVTFEEDTCTGALPGKLLRSYDMVG